MKLMACFRMWSIETSLLIKKRAAFKKLSVAQAQ